MSTLPMRNGWDFCMTEIMKTEPVHNLFVVLMSLCDSDTKNQIKPRIQSFGNDPGLYGVA